MIMAYEQQIYKRPDTGKLYSIVNGTAREFVDQEAAAKLNPNAQAMDWGRGTSGYSSQFGGGTTGGAWRTADFTGMLNQQAQTQALNQAAEQAAAKSNAQVASSVPVAPTDFQKYFQGELAKGRAAGDILSNNPFMAGQAQGPAQIQTAAAPQPTMNTTQFAAQFQTQNGRPPTQAELQAFVQNRSAGVPKVSQAPQAPTQTASSYAGSSIVDYLSSIKQPTDFASRAKLAAANGITGYTGTAEQNLQLLNKLRAVQPPAQKQAGTITADSFKKESTLGIGETPTPTPDSTIETSKTLQKSVDENLKLLEGEKSPDQLLAEKSTSRAMQLLADSLGRSKMLSEEEKKAGADEFKLNLKNIQNELATKTAAYEKLYADIAGKPITMNSIIGADAQARRVAQADLGFLNAQALAMQNNIEFAKQTAKDAVDTKYGPIDEEIAILAKQLELIQPTLDKEEKLRANAVTMALQQRKEALDVVKEKENTLTDFNINMIAKYPSAGIRTTDDYTATQQKILNSAEYKADMATATKKSSGGGGGGAWAPSGTTIPTPTTPKQTFEEFVTQEENKAGQTFSQAKRDELRKTYDATQVTPTSTAQNADLSSYDFVVRQVILGNEPASNILTGGTQSERRRYQTQLDDAEKKGLLQKTYSGSQETYITKLNDSVLKSPIYAKTVEMKNFADNVQGSLSLGTGIGDIAAINQFQKVIDEGAVTRDQDVKLIQSTESLYNRLTKLKKKWKEGDQLSPQLRAEMNATVNALYQGRARSLQSDPYIKSKIKEAEGRGIKKDDTILGELGNFVSSAPLSSGAKGKTSSGISYTIE